MPTFNAAEYANFAARPQVFNAPGLWYSRLRCFQATVALVGQTVGDDVLMFDLPAGFRPAFGVLSTPVSLGAATVSIGSTTQNGKYRAAATLTSADTPVLFGVAAAANGPLGAGETVRLLVDSGTLPGSVGSPAGPVTVRLFGTGLE